MLKTLLTIAFAAILGSCLLIPAFAGVGDDVSALMESTRKQEVVDVKTIHNYPPDELLVELEKYTGDAESRVRLMVISLTVDTLQRHFDDSKLQKQALELILTIAKSDEDESISGYAASIPYTFPVIFSGSTFTPSMQQDILRLVTQDNPRRESVLLAGFANVQSARERIEKLTAPGVTGIGWVAHLALARMGVQSSINHVVKEF